MHNPFAKPHTSEEWVLSSVCWTLLCLAAWIALTWSIIGADLSYDNKKYELTLLFCCFIVPYVAAWVNAAPPECAFGSRDLFAQTCAILWTIALFIVLMGWLLVALFILALSGPPTSWGF